MGVSSLPKTVTRHRRDCDLKPGPSAPESSTLTTRLPSHHRYIGLMINLVQAISLLPRDSTEWGIGTERAHFPRRWSRIGTWMNYELYKPQMYLRSLESWPSSGASTLPEPDNYGEHFFREWYVTFLPPYSQQHCSEHCCLISTTRTTFIHRKSVILYTVPPTRTKLGERAFSSLARQLETHYRVTFAKSQTLVHFKRHLKFYSLIIIFTPGVGYVLCCTLCSMLYTLLAVNIVIGVQ